ncbi:GlsB/YeaQ/YmgE family stress response membrane protein [Roseicyclus sp. F158]|uniref:GlsB/YeaQ/YmgE family stress response membrane protein n=1 Tax=Tropicimonas omnivorans TaxID=3075590 RepID=A0ABU3DE45_9RHOB|nr:GlsB/YeaQ/YmgE family stress response membrane protein [Roseicyclus sp. F158]MDT0681996.1 GlsB/YeaQ/YmgE family stress response membrane protein [Roseicyclus sp. F158]
METFFDALGAVGLIFLVIVGLIAGYIASMIAGGRNRIFYLIAGVVGAVAVPFILTALGIIALGALGLILLLVIGAIGAAVILAIVAAIRR